MLTLRDPQSGLAGTLLGKDPSWGAGEVASEGKPKACELGGNQ